MHQPKRASHLELLDNRLIDVLDVTPVPIIISHPDSGAFKYVNPALMDMLGYSAQEIYSTEVVVSHPDDLENNQKLRRHLQQSPFEPVTLEKRYLHKSGRVILGLLTMVAEKNKDGSIKHLIAQIIDITERKAYQEDNLLFKTLINQSNDGMLIMCADSGLIVNANQRCCDNLGYSLTELQALTIRDIEVKLFDQFNWAEYVKDIKNKGNQILEGLHRRKDGSPFPVEISVSYVEFVNHSYMVAIVRDMTDRKKRDELIWQQANYDALTKLPNRYMFMDRLEQEMKKANRHNTQVALLCIDIDNFKDVNDSFGHDQGDKLLVKFAERLKACIRHSDTFARLGGDEFAIIIGGVDDTAVIDTVAKKVLHELSSPIDLGLKKTFVSGSIGIALYPDDGITAEDLLKNADNAMYEVKRNGRNGYQYFTRVMHAKAIQRIELITDLHRALDDQEFEMVYQPIVDMQSKKIIKAEALVRWNRDANSMVNPDKFIPAAEESGLIIELGNWIFEEVSRQMKIWRELGNENMQINVNMSPIQFNDKDNIILSSWINCLHKYQLNGSDFTVEITENAMMKTHADDDINDKLKLLHNNGIKIALDDFGTGCSSLVHLKKARNRLS